MRTITCLALALSLSLAGAQPNPKFNPTDVGASLGTNSVAQAVNNPGHVVGYWVRDIGTAAFLYRSNQVFELTALGTTANVALSINDDGQVVGHSWLTNEFRAFHFDGTNINNLGDWGGTNSFATGINASNRISGYVESTNGVLGIYFDGQPYDIGSLGGNATYAYGLNATGIIVGAATTTNDELHAFRHDGSGIQDLNLQFPGGVTLTIARAVNSVGSIVGWASSNNVNLPFLITDTNLTLIPLLPSATSGHAYALNAANAVVGTCETTNGNRAFLWRDGSVYDLNDCVATNSGWVLREATGINDSGRIVGWGHINGEIHAFLLTPNQAPSVAITSPTNTASFVSPFDLTITATAADDVEVAKVEFYVGNQLIGSKATAPYTITWPDVCAGNYAFTAIAYDNLGAASTSAVVNVIVTLPEAASLKCWLKPESLSGSTCTYWSDSSGSGNNASYWGTAPQVWTNQINGYAAVKFNGTSDRLSMPAFLATAGEAEAFIIVKAGTNATDRLWQFSAGGNPGSYSASGIADTFGSAYMVGGYNSKVSQYHIYHAGAYTNGWFSRINGNHQASTTISWGFFGSYAVLGASYSSSYGWYYGTPCVSEFIVFKKKLTQPQRVSVTKYLSRKFALATFTLPTPTLQGSALSTNKISLNWTFCDTSEWVGVKVERKTPGNSFTEIARPENVAFYLDTVTPGQAYVYRVKFYNALGETDYSNEVTVNTEANTTGLPFGNMTLWLRADAGFPKNGSAAWSDQSGCGNTASASGVSLVPNSINAQPAVRFNGTNCVVTLKPASIPASSQQAEMVVVLRAMSSSPAVPRALGFFGYADYNGSTITYYPAVGGAISSDFATRTAKAVGTSGQSITNWHIFDVHSKTNDWAGRINGIIGASTSVNTFATPNDSYPPLLGKTGPPYGGLYYFDGFIAEMMTFNKVLSLAEREAIGRYLNKRYALITNAPGIPTNLHCRAVSPQQIEVSWNATTNTTSYCIERKSSDGPYIPLATLDPRTNKYVDTFQSSEPLTYRVSAQNYFATNSAELVTPLAIITTPPANQAQLVGQTIGISIEPNNSPTNYTLVYTNWAYNTPGNGYITISNANNLVFSGRTPFTIECRVKPTTVPTNWVGVVSRYNTYIGGNWMLDLDPGGIPFLFREASPWNKARATSGIPTNVWTHLAGSYDGTNMILYVNGVVAGTAINTNNSQASTISLLLGAGQSSSVATRYFNGQIDEVRFWSKSLSASNILAWKDSVLNSAHPDYNSLLRYIPLDGPTNGISVTNGTFPPLSGYNPFRVDLYADGSLYQSWTDTICETTFLSAVPRRWSFITLATDGFSNTRYSAALNTDFIYPSANDLANLPDSDGDGLPDYIETFITTNPNLQDTDDDGMPDWWEIWYGLNPRRNSGRDGANGDFDNDGITNAQEYANGTSPADGLNGGSSSLQLHRPN